MIEYPFWLEDSAEARFDAIEACVAFLLEAYAGSLEADSRLQDALERIDLGDTSSVARRDLYEAAAAYWTYAPALEVALDMVMKARRLPDCGS